MRRGFWLVTGAVLGVTGYRRAARLARALTGPSRDGSAVPATRRPPAAIQLRWRSPLALTMRTPASPARPVRPGERIASAVGFVRDVHEGMAEYRDLHRSDAGHTLEGQGNQLTSGRPSPGRTSASPNGRDRREP